ncbi:MAG: NAD(P)/FAD-dependent oxidoreductase [Bryobacteraceae bacterium]
MGWSKARTIAAAGAGFGGVFLGWKLWQEADVRRRNRSLPPGKKVLILGSGFAGVTVAQELSKLLPAQSAAEISLVDRNNFLLFTPMLTEVAGGELDARHIVASPRRLSRGINFEEGEIQEIDLANRRVVLNIGDGDGSKRTLTADHLVIALGSVPAFHGIPGLQEHSLAIKSVGDAAAIRNRVLACLERAHWETDAHIRREVLTFVVGGGGYTGVETMAAVNDLARESVKDYPNVQPDEISTFIVEPGDRLLSELSSDLAAFAQQKLQEHGVKVRLRTKITSAAQNYVEFEGGNRIPTRTLIWAGGITPNPLIGKLDCARGHHHGIVVDECCSVPDHPGVWALGDCAEVPKQGSQGTYAPTAQNATREGALVARNIVAVLRGEKPEPFAFKTIGELALVGKHSGVAKIYGQHFSGFLAWAMWRAIYLSKMPGMGQRARILLDWILDFFFGRSIAEFPIDPSRG